MRNANIDVHSKQGNLRAYTSDLHISVDTKISDVWNTSALHIDVDR